MTSCTLNRDKWFALSFINNWEKSFRGSQGENIPDIFTLESKCEIIINILKTQLDTPQKGLISILDLVALNLKFGHRVKNTICNVVTVLTRILLVLHALNLASFFFESLKLNLYFKH